MRTRFLAPARASMQILASLSKNPGGWMCSACRVRSFTTTSNLRTNSGKKPYYVTTPIFYVNGAPHIGHLYTLVLADILKRWHVLRGKSDAILVTGTDEHGMKIQRAAAAVGMDAKSFCDTSHKDFAVLAQRAGLSHDRFIRTTDSDHKDAVEFFWIMLNQRGYIYQKKHKGWYSVSDETFYPQNAVQLALDPATGRKIMTSIETGKEVELTSELNYHFRLSAFKDRLLEHYEKHPDFIVPQQRMSEIVQQVSDGLEDLSVSRPVERLTWGVRVPNDDSQTIYVWLDALVNYLTSAGYPFTPGQETKGGWPADVHVIGKDIIRFHCIYWPAFLMALDLPLPHRILTHAHWTLDRRKMSKSVGNVVNPFFALDRFGQDVMRYYLALDGGIVDDADYENAYIVDRYKKGLQNGLGNMTSRITRGKGWNVATAVESVAQNANKQHRFHTFSQQQRALLEELPEKVNGKMNALNPGAALKEIMEMIYATNKFMQDASPWQLVKTKPLPGSDAYETLQEIIYLCAEALRICGILLQPYIPNKAALLLDMLGVDANKRLYEHAEFGIDCTYGQSIVPIGKGLDGVLFPPLICET